ncbi:MAG TPA: nucleotidyltransferase substrate binding protein [Stellaceae bacterium]|nr:nucleotidyltransferase substrate binding protein [Stellaceae bacterium]
MARIDDRLVEASAALATLDELMARNDLNLAERDGAILRLVYTFEAIWKAAALLLDREGISIGSPRGAIVECRQVGWVGDGDAETLLKLAKQRNLTVHMYRQEIGEEIASHLRIYAIALGIWLDALKRHAASGD